MTPEFNIFRDLTSNNPPSSPLNPNAAPSGNFDLLDWKLTLPIDLDNNNRADEIEERQLSEGFQDSRYFYTGKDGGMVFRAPIEGARTSTNTKYTRTELREMLRQGNRAFSTKGVGGNNWVFSSAPSQAQDAAGGVDGELTATLAVNHVTTTGDRSQVGRVIIGQIHANDAEPVRIYYRKLPENVKGSIYIAHEPRTGPDQKYDLIGSRSRSARNPENGIALNEKFSYKVNVVGDLLTVTIIRPGKPNVVQEVNMDGSGYDDPNQYMYFKAGVYNQNNTGDPNDYVQATFYALDNKHTGYSPNPTPVDVIPEHNTTYINAGGERYDDLLGNQWSASKGFSNGRTFSTANPIDQTEEDVLYQSEYYGRNFSFQQELQNGSYDVTLKFAEIYFNQAGKRVFDVKIEDKLVLNDFDIYTRTGGINIAYDQTFKVDVNDSLLNIDFFASVNNAKISGIVIEPSTSLI